MQEKKDALRIEWVDLRDKIRFLELAPMTIDASDDLFG